MIYNLKKKPFLCFFLLNELLSLFHHFYRTFVGLGYVKCYVLVWWVFIFEKWFLHSPITISSLFMKTIVQHSEYYLEIFLFMWKISSMEKGRRKVTNNWNNFIRLNGKWKSLIRICASFWQQQGYMSVVNNDFDVYWTCTK